MASESQGLLATLVIDVGFFVVCGVGVWLWRCCRKLTKTEPTVDGFEDNVTPLLRSSTSGKEGTPLHVTAKNYLEFLRTGALLFLILSIISVSTCGVPPAWREQIAFDQSSLCSGGFPVTNTSGVSDCQAGDYQNWVLHTPRPHDPRPAAHYLANTTFKECKGAAMFCQTPTLAYDSASGQCWLFNLTQPLHAAKIKGFVVCHGRQGFLSGMAQFFLSIVYGAITILLAFMLLVRLSTGEINDLSKLTVWLTEIPTADREDGEPFELESEEAFLRVGQDLQHAITAALNARLAAAGITGPFREERKVVQVYVVHQSGSESRLAGHAFATLSREAYVSAMLMRATPMCGLDCLKWLPSYVHWRSHTLLKFGIPPWSAVTLRCQRAPPPSDIIWENLHVRYGWLGCGLLQLLLFAFVLVFVAPVSLANSIYTVVDSLHKGKVIGQMLPEGVWAMLEHVVLQLPSYWLLLMDSIIVPYAIEFISQAERPHLNSRSEYSQFCMNLRFLLLNALAVPMLGFLATDRSILEQAVAHYSSALEGGTLKDALSSIALRGMQIPDMFMLKYLLNAALVSTGFQLIQVRNIFLRCICMGELPWPFAWGYWYAWSMSILFTALSLSLLMPAVLPVAMISFLLMYWVHREHLARGIFSVPFELDRQFEVGIVCRMVQAVSLLWLLTAVGLYTRPLGGADEAVDLWVLRLPEGRAGAVASGTLVALAAATFCGGRVLFAEDGWLERRTWRKLGEHGSSRVLSACDGLAVASLLGSWCLRPRTELHRIQVRIHMAFACALLVLSVLAWLASLAMQGLGSRFVRGTSLQRLSQRTLEDCDHHEEFDLVGTLALRSEPVPVRQRMWYMPLGRRGTLQQSQVIRHTLSQ
mmetsp:Transcript_83472/g.260658  ORF Transcript_83472/g.260658 Transcript_83472/m.260658 type:complete len:872 (+) Transcript_83472:101-2716(+)